MAGRLSWFCADSAQPLDPKITNLPDNDYRWVFHCLLCFEKRGDLAGQDVSLFWKHCDVTRKKMAKILEALRETGLIGDDNRPVDFDGWQRRALESERSRKYRERHAPVTHPSRIRHAPVTTDTDTDTDTEKGKGKAPRPPSNLQKDMISQMCAEKETKLADVLKQLDLEDLTKANVSTVKAHIKALPGPDPEKVATEAKAKRLAGLRAALLDRYATNPAEAGVWIGEQEKSLQGALWIAYKELEGEI